MKCKAPVSVNLTINMASARVYTDTTLNSLLIGDEEVDYGCRFDLRACPIPADRVDETDLLLIEACSVANDISLLMCPEVTSAWHQKGKNKCASMPVNKRGLVAQPPEVVVMDGGFPKYVVGIFQCCLHVCLVLSTGIYYFALLTL